MKPQSSVKEYKGHPCVKIKRKHRLGLLPLELEEQ